MTKIIVYANCPEMRTSFHYIDYNGVKDGVYAYVGIIEIVKKALISQGIIFPFNIVDYKFKDFRTEYIAKLWPEFLDGKKTAGELCNKAIEILNKNKAWDTVVFHYENE
jgi:hypothetical protein